MDPLKIAQMVRDVKCHNYRLLLKSFQERYIIQIYFERIDAETGLKSIGIGREWLLKDDCTEEDVLFTCLAAALFVSEHETREAFTYKGKKVFSPHTKVEQLLKRSE